jgi:ABC-type transport system involved in cytochrome c biogenesis permease component
MINNFFKLIANEFHLMIKGSVFSFVLFCLLVISSTIFALALRHISFEIEIPMSFLWVMMFFISLIKVEKVYQSEFSESKLQQYMLSPFSL